MFHTTTVLVTMCQPDGDAPAGHELLRPQRDALRTRTASGGHEFHLPHGEWVRLLRACGFVIDALHELHAPPDARPHPYYGLATVRWAQQWPAEEIWVAHLPG